METIKADVVVVGGGLAAHRAGIEASTLGASVLMLEKMPVIGGSTVLSGGSFCFAGTELQKRAGIEDGPDQLRRDLIDAGGGQADISLIDLFVREQLGEYQFLRDRGVFFGAIQSSSGQSVPRLHPADPRKVLFLLHDELKAAPRTRILMEARATRIQRDGHDGRFREMLVQFKSGQVSVRAERGIVLATGGFSRSADLLKLFAPELRKAFPGGGLGNEGDGLRMAWEHGAAFADLGFVKATFGSYAYVDADRPSTRPLLPIYRGAIAVNLQGLRFVDESQSYKALGKACLDQENARAFQIFDDSVMAQSVDGVPSFDFRAAMRENQFVQAGALAELGAKINVDPKNFVNTLATYNEDVRSGHDRQFGRRTLVYKYGSLAEISKAPFYAYPCTTAMHSTYAGLRVRNDMTVLNVWNEPLPGLYAAGEVVGGFHGEGYMTGSSLVKALVFGRIAVRSAMQAP